MNDTQGSLPKRSIQVVSPFEASGMTFETAVQKAKTALWSEGRSVILIIDGAEREFPFDSVLSEAKALALLKDNGVSLIREDAPGIAVFRTAIACMLVLLFLVT